MTRLTRRSLIGAGAAALALPQILHAQAPARVVIVGGGFGGAAVARLLVARNPALSVTLIEAEGSHTTCPFSNAVLGGLKTLEDITFSYDALRAQGVDVVHAMAADIDPVAKTLRAGDGMLGYDVLVLSPGISFDYDVITGYSAELAETAMPHAWKAGAQTALLARQIDAMPVGGTFAIAIPAPPFRCPPGPYERISLVAHRLKTINPTAKILVLDAQDGFSKQPLFEEAWAKHYPGMITRIPASESGAVIEVDAASRRVSTAFDDFTPDVANVIPPQRAGRIVLDTGLDGGLGWAPIDPVSFESTVAPDIYILGDAAVAGEMPKSAFSAHVQAAVVADAILARLHGRAPESGKLLNTCYSLVAPDDGISIAHVFERGDAITLVERDNRTTPLGASAAHHAAEARYAAAWYDTVTGLTWG